MKLDHSKLREAIQVALEQPDAQLITLSTVFDLEQHKASNA